MQFERPCCAPAAVSLDERGEVAERYSAMTALSQIPFPCPYIQGYLAGLFGNILREREGEDEKDEGERDPPACRLPGDCERREREREERKKELGYSILGVYYTSIPQEREPKYVNLLLYISGYLG